MTARDDCGENESREMAPPRVIYMVTAIFKVHPVVTYRHFQDRARFTPEGLRYIGGWVSTSVWRYFQLLETGNRALIDEWTAPWKEVADFEVLRVAASPTTLEMIDKLFG